jgi:hypothetical protein
LLKIKHKNINTPFSDYKKSKTNVDINFSARDGFLKWRHQVRSKLKDLWVKLTSLFTIMSHNLHFELLCMLLRKLPVVIHVNITIFGVVIRSLWTKNDLINKARGKYYIQSLMKIVHIFLTYDMRVCACVRVCVCVVVVSFFIGKRERGN